MFNIWEHKTNQELTNYPYGFSSFNPYGRMIQSSRSWRQGAMRLQAAHIVLGVPDGGHVSGRSRHDLSPQGVNLELKVQWIRFRR